MKKLIYIVAAIGLSATAAVAHEHGPGASTSGLFGMKAEYLHVLLNPLPVYGLAIGLALLALGFARRIPPLRIAGLIISAVSAASAWPVLYYGQHAYNSLAPMLDTESEQWLDTHMERAERFVYFFYATAVLGVAALICPRKSPKAASVLSATTLALGLGSLGLGAWISRAGGQISHSEFRSEAAAAPAASGHSHEAYEESSQHSPEQPVPHPHDLEPAVDNHPHQEAKGTPQAPAGQAHDSEEAPAQHHHKETPVTVTNSAHETIATTNPPASSASAHVGHEPQSGSHAETNPPAASGTSAAATPHQHQHDQPQAHSRTNASPATGERLPDTPEAIWTQLHRRHDLFDKAIKENNTAEIHANAVAIEKLANALVAVVHPDYQASVRKGADQIIAGARGAHRAAHADDPAAVASNFNLFDQSLTQLEQKMKHQ